MVTTVDEFSWGNAAVLESVNIGLSFVSLAGAAFVIVCYWLLGELRSCAFRMVACLAFSDMLFALANLMGDPHNPSTWLGASHALCGFQAYAQQKQRRRVSCRFVVFFLFPPR